MEIQLCERCYHAIQPGETYGVMRSIVGSTNRGTVLWANIYLHKWDVERNDCERIMTQCPNKNCDGNCPLCKGNNTP